MITRILIAASLLLCCGCSPNLEKARELAQKYPECGDEEELFFLTPELAADLVLAETQFKKCDFIALNGLKSIDRYVARELAKFRGREIFLDGLTSISKDVAYELAQSQCEGFNLNGLTSIDKDVAQGLAKFKGTLVLYGLNSIDKDAAHELVKFKGENIFLFKDKVGGAEDVRDDIMKILKSNPKIELI